MAGRLPHSRAQSSSALDPRSNPSDRGGTRPTSLSEQIDEMNKDDFDVIPDDPDYVYDERELAEAGDDPVLLRQLVEKLAAQAARKREREEESD